MLLIQHTHSCIKLGKTEMTSYAADALQVGHPEKQKTSASVTRFLNPEMSLKDTVEKFILVFH